ncbi:MAG: ribose-phosphate pyrophosphokinase [Planctomycetes bacterium]|jgi:ribose-phosphate pyrophosphokinase|nr:ribose-phosphate pyrophosphokinase [Planctomycetota bacterium]
MLNKGLKIFTGNANPELAKAISHYLEVPLGRAVVGKFPDGEVNIKIDEDVRGRDVFVIQPTCPPVDQNLMELLILNDCLRRASAASITAVIPYFGYARKDRKDEGRVPITSKLVANLITTSGAGRVLTMELHAAQIQGFFDIPVDHLYSSPVFVTYIRSLRIKNLTVVAPDVGGVKMARSYAKHLQATLAIVDKRRISPDSAEVYNVIGDVQGRNILLVDDMIATGGTVVEAANILKKNGAGDIYLCATHPVLCGPAIERINGAPLKEVIVSDSIPIEGKHVEKIRVLSVAPLLGEAIKRIHFSESVSELFKFGD